MANRRPLGPPETPRAPSLRSGRTHQRGRAGALAAALGLGGALVLLVLPLVALLARAPWSTLGSELVANEVRMALWLSLRTSFAAAACACGLGLPLAAWLARGEGTTRSIVRILVTLPMVLPPVVAGVGLLLAFGRNGLVGRPLAEHFGFTLPFTPYAVVVAGTYVALPFFVLTVEGALRTLDRRYEDAAAVLGAGPWRRLVTITLPLVAPALGAGLVIAWARALGEFGATITFAGNLAGTTRTLPLAVYTALETRPEGAIALSLVLVGVSVVLLVLSRRQWWPRP